VKVTKATLSLVLSHQYNPGQTTADKRALCPPVEPNAALPRTVSSKSCEGVIEMFGAGGEPAYLNDRNFRSVDTFEDQLSDAVALVD